jgi:hypothetical protein
MAERPKGQVLQIGPMFSTAAETCPYVAQPPPPVRRKTNRWMKKASWKKEEAGEPLILANSR